MLHKEEKGEKQISYDNLWPQIIDDPKVRSQIENLPTDIMRILNKDLSEAYNLLMESLYDPTLKKLIRYDRIRDLYQFVTEIILKNKNKNKKEKEKEKEKDKKEKKQLGKETKQKRAVNKTQKSKNEKAFSKTQWTLYQEKYLCALYLQRSLVKCSEKLKQKFGQSQKWNSTKKIFNKAEQLFQKALKNVVRSNQLKDFIEKLQTNRQNLIGKIIQRKSSLIEKSVLRYYRSGDAKKKSKNLNDISRQISIIMQSKSEILSVNSQKTQENQNLLKQNSQTQVKEQKIKEETETSPSGATAQVKYQQADQIKPKQ